MAGRMIYVETTRTAEKRISPRIPRKRNGFFKVSSALRFSSRIHKTVKKKSRARSPRVIIGRIKSDSEINRATMPCHRKNTQENTSHGNRFRTHDLSRNSTITVKSGNAAKSGMKDCKTSCSTDEK